MSWNAETLGMLLMAALLPLAGCGAEEGDDDDETVSDVGLGDDDTASGDDDTQEGDDDASSGGDDDDTNDSTPQVYPNCSAVTGDAGGVEIGLDRGETLIENRLNLNTYSVTWDIEILPEGSTVWESFMGRLYRSSSAGCVFGRISNLPADTFKEITLNPEHPDRLFLSADSSADLIHTSDGGTTWELDTLQGGGALAFAIDPADVEKLFYVGSDGRLYTSSNDGATWSSKVIDVPEDTEVINAAFHPEDPRTVIVGTDKYAWYRTTDGGDDWEALHTNLYGQGETSGSPELESVHIAFSAASSDIVYGVLNRTTGGGELYRSDDGGSSWNEISRETSAGTDLQISTQTRVYPDPVSPDRFLFWYGSYYREYGTDLYICEYEDGGCDLTLHHYDFFDMYAMAFHPLDPSILYLGRVNDSVEPL